MLPELDAGLTEQGEHVLDAMPLVQCHGAPYHAVKGTLQRAFQHLVGGDHHVVRGHVQQLLAEDLALRGLVAVDKK